MFFRRKAKPPIFTPLQAAVGIAATARTGGGKTSFIQPVVEELADQGCFICICCAKPDEADAYARLLNRFNPLRLKPGNGVFNPIQYELNRKGGSVANLAAFHDDLSEVWTRTTSEKTEPFWKHITTGTLTNAISLAHFVKDDATYKDVYDIIMSAPMSVEHSQSFEFRASPCGVFLNAALGTPTDANLQIADFFLRRLCSVGDKARGAAVTGAAASIQPFIAEPMSQLVNGKSTITPESMLEQFTILDLDTLTYGKEGLAFQLLMSWFCMEAVLRRKGDFPYFVLVRDEYPFYAFPRRDVATQSVGRSQRFIGISSFQSIPVLESAMGGDAQAKTDAQAIYGLHVNKIIGNNNDHTTNELNAEIIGKERKMFFGGSTQPNQEPQWWDVIGVGQSPSFSFNQQWHYRVPPTTFNSLATGGPDCNYIVEAIVHRGHDQVERISISQR